MAEKESRLQVAAAAAAAVGMILREGEDFRGRLLPWQLYSLNNNIIRGARESRAITLTTVTLLCQRYVIVSN